MISKILLLILTAIIVFGIFILLLSKDSDVDNADYVIVLGHKLNNNHADETFKYRLRKALEYADNNPNSKFVLSGGITKGNTISEAQIMKDYLTKNGVANELILEDKSIDTVENIINCKNYIDNKQKVVLISSNYHIVRSRMICRLLGLKVKGIGVYTPIFVLLKHLPIEELFIFIHYFRIKKRGA